MTHWKKLSNRDYLGAWSLEPGKDLTLTIKEVKRQPVPSGDGKVEDCIVCHWAESGRLPMVLNSTNCKTIEKVLKSPHIEEWSGKQITLYTAQVKAFGDTVDAIRIRPITAKTTKEALPESDPRWTKAIEAVKAGTATVESIAARFELNPNQVAALSGAAPSAAKQQAK